MKNIAVLYALLMLPNLSLADPTTDQAMERLLSHYQTRCNLAQAEFRDIDDDLKAPLRGKLALDPNNVYRLKLSNTGATWVVLYPEFLCENAGYEVPH